MELLLFLVFPSAHYMGYGLAWINYLSHTDTYLPIKMNIPTGGKMWTRNQLP